MCVCACVCTIVPCVLGSHWVKTRFSSVVWPLYHQHASRRDKRWCNTFANRLLKTPNRSLVINLNHQTRKWLLPNLVDNHDSCLVISHWSIRVRPRRRWWRRRRREIDSRLCWCFSCGGILLLRCAEFVERIHSASGWKQRRAKHSKWPPFIYVYKYADEWLLRRWSRSRREGKWPFMCFDSNLFSPSSSISVH